MSERKAPPSPPRLTRERILDAALGIVERDGPAALSMRRLAQELDVWPMSIYRHFRDKDELVGALTDAATELVELPAEAGPWRAQMAELVHNVRDALARGSDLRPLRGNVVPGGPRLAEAALGILEQAGLDSADSVRSWQALFGYAIGYPGRGGDGPAPAAVIAGLPQEDHPRLWAAIAELATPAGDRASFDYGLELLLDGIAARLS